MCGQRPTGCWCGEALLGVEPRKLPGTERRGNRAEFGNLDPIGTEAEGRVKIIESGLKGHHLELECRATPLAWGTLSFLNVPFGCLTWVTLLIYFLVK